MTRQKDAGGLASGSIPEAALIRKQNNMPHYNKENILVVTKDEVLQARDMNGKPFFKDWNNLKVTLYRYENKTCGIKRADRGGGRGCVVTIVFDSLPQEIQDAIGDPRKKEHILLDYFQIDQDAVAFYNSYRTPTGELKDSQKQAYVTTASLLNAGLALIQARRAEWLGKGKNTVRGLEASVCEDLRTFASVLVRKFHREYNLPENMIRLREKLRNYGALNGQERYASLVKGVFGNQHASVKTFAQMQLLESMFMSQKHKPTPTEVADQYSAFLSGYVEIINQETGEVYDPKEYGKLSLRTITSYLDTWHSKIVTFSKRAGNRQRFISEFMPGGSMLKPEYAGSIISVDDRNPPFWYAKGKRVWFYCAYDVGAQCFTAWVYGKTKEGIIVDFYRNIVRNYTAWGIPLPAEIECESSLNATYRNNMLSEGGMFQYVRMEANKARAKYIEGIWGKLRYGTEKKREGWLARPNSLRESNQKGEDDCPIIPFDDIVYDCLTDIQNWNNSLHPDQEKYKGMTRWEVFTENQNPNLRQETNWKMILPYIGYKTESSCNTGTIKLQRKEFFLGIDGEITTGDELISLLELLEGKEVDVYWLDDNEGNVMKALVYLRGGERCICEAIQKPKFHRAKIEQTAEDRKNMGLVMAYINTFSGYISRRKSEIDKVMVIDHRTTVVNNKFIIPGLEQKRHYEDDGEPEILEPETVEPETVETEQVEVLDEGNDENPFENHLKDIQKDDKQILIQQLTSNF